MSRSLRLGVQLWPQTADWGLLDTAALRVDALRYDYLFAWDHFLSPVGDPQLPVLEGYSVLAAWAVRTSRARLGLLVGANTFRDPAQVAKIATTLDHLSSGRMVLALGGAWNEHEHRAFGIEFGQSAGERLDWLEEALGVVAPLVRGDEVTHSGPRYRTDHLRLSPGPFQPRIPILVGGAGERKTLLSVARHADMWSVGVSADVARHKLSVLRTHCEAVGRDPDDIELAINSNIVIRSTREDAWAALRSLYGRRGLDFERDDPNAWFGTPEAIAERISEYLPLGFSTFITAMPPPYDFETLDRLVGEVGPLLGRPHAP